MTTATVKVNTDPGVNAKQPKASDKAEKVEVKVENKDNTTMKTIGLVILGAIASILIGEYFMLGSYGIYGAIACVAAGGAYLLYKNRKKDKKEEKTEVKVAA